MANDFDMLKDIILLQNQAKKINRQARKLDLMYFYKYIEPNPKKLEQLKKLYIKQYGSLDNYV